NNTLSFQLTPFLLFSLYLPYNFGIRETRIRGRVSRTPNSCLTNFFSPIRTTSRISLTLIPDKLLM
ncbi:MAG: hypothetical protein ABI372_07375, partial [Ginsengibacter sp.]